MKQITIPIPDDFTAEQVEFIKKSAMNQIAAEIKKVLEVPVEVVAAAEAKIAEVQAALDVIEAVPLVEPPAEEPPAEEPPAEEPPAEEPPAEEPPA